MRPLAFAASVAALLCACKDKQTQQAPPPAPEAKLPSAPAPAPNPEAARPSLPTPPAKPEGEPLSIEDAAAALPNIEGKEILPLKQTSDKRQVHGTWCIDGESADDVARKVGRMMAEARYANLAIRGDARKAGVQGDRDGYRMSMVVSASSAASCPAPQHYFASATMFRP